MPKLRQKCKKKVHVESWVLRQQGKSITRRWRGWDGSRDRGSRNIFFKNFARGRMNYSQDDRASDTILPTIDSPQLPPPSFLLIRLFAPDLDADRHVKPKRTSSHPLSRCHVASILQQLKKNSQKLGYLDRRRRDISQTFSKDKWNSHMCKIIIQSKTDNLISQK